MLFARIKQFLLFFNFKMLSSSNCFIKISFTFYVLDRITTRNHLLYWSLYNERGSLLLMMIENT